MAQQFDYNAFIMVIVAAMAVGQVVAQLFKMLLDKMLSSKTNNGNGKNGRQAAMYQAIGDISTKVNQMLEILIRLDEFLRRE